MPTPTDSASRRKWIILGLLLLGTLAIFTYDRQGAVDAESLPVAKFVGRQSCIACHQAEAKQYHGSHHDRAMEIATKQTVLGDFDDASLTHQGVTMQMSRRDGKFLMTAEGADGEMHEYEIGWTFGIDPLQQYMTRFPDGRVQVLPASWDVIRSEWFAVTPPDVPDERILPDDPLHWTAHSQNWNASCADCHSTNLKKNYDVATDTYRTTFSEIDVSCEACHGPGSNHVTLANQTSWFSGDSKGGGLVNRIKGGGRGRDGLTEPGQLEQLETCAHCHSRRGSIHPNYHAGEHYSDHYELSLLETGLYHVDGQILDEVYVHGSFLQSKMHSKGVRCTDCHNPHSLQLKLPGNQLCSQCHQPGKYDVPAHHHHPDLADGTPSEGASCVACHMPSKVYMNIDRRHDHSFRVPRPDLTVQLGTPNACNACHVKESEGPAWAAEQIRQWRGPDADAAKTQAHGNWATALAAGRSVDPAGEQQLIELLRDEETPSIVRATAVQLLAYYDSEASARARSRARLDESDLVKNAAAKFVIPWGTRNLVDLLRPSLTHARRSVRFSAMLRLVPLAFQQDDAELRDTLQSILEDFRQAQAVHLDSEAGHLNLATLAQQTGHLDTAAKHLRQAVKKAPYRADSKLMLAELLGQSEGHEEEIRSLREQAAEHLLRDQKLLPENDVLHYRRGMLLYQLGKPKSALKEVQAAARLEPDRYQNWLGIALLSQQLADWESAFKALKQMQRIQPESQDIPNLYQQFRAAAQADGSLPSGEDAKRGE